MGSKYLSKNPKTQHKRKRQNAAKLAAASRWKNSAAISISATSRSSAATPSSTSTNKLEGSRVIDLICFSEMVSKISEHNQQCGGKCEIYREGLASIFEVSCDSCEDKFTMETSTKIAGSKGINNRYSVNVGAVWGQMATGGGQRKLNEMMASIGIPSMSKGTFIRIETQIGNKWEDILSTEIQKAGEEEKRLAIERKDFFQDVPAITVVVDGGWSKRSHAKSGVALIIGKETNKLLYLGIRNKFCSICAIAKSNGLTPKKHACNKNWSDSSSAMEVDILITGFNIVLKVCMA